MTKSSRKPSYEQPTAAALARAPNKLSLFPEFAEIKSIVSKLRDAHLQTLEVEHASQATVSTIHQHITNTQRAVTLLADAVLNESSALRDLVKSRDHELKRMQSEHEASARQVSELMTWARNAQRDLDALRSAIKDDVRQDQAAIRRTMHEQAAEISSLKAKLLTTRDEVAAAATVATAARVGNVGGESSYARAATNARWETRLADLETRMRAHDARQSYVASTMGGYGGFKR